MFATKEEAIAHVQALPGYKPPIQYDPTPYTEDMGSERHICQAIFYPQVVGSSGKLKSRRAILREVQTLHPDGSTSPLGWEVDFELVSESDEGHPKSVRAFSGPNEYYPWTESLYGHMARDGSDAVLKTIPHPMTGAPTDYYVKEISKVITTDFGFQNIYACWARMNEGDFVDVFVDAPVIDMATGQLTGAWQVAAQFAANVTLFDSNPQGTCYPPDQSPAMSWVVPGCRIRVVLHKLAVNDPNLVNQRGPFLDVDIIGQRKRPGY